MIASRWRRRGNLRKRLEDKHIKDGTMRMQFTLAIRYLAGRKLRTVLTTLAIVFGVLVLFGMNTMLPALINAFQANVKAAAGEVDATVTLKTSDPFSASVADRVASIEGVSTINAYL